MCADYAPRTAGGRGRQGRFNTASAASLLLGLAGVFLWVWGFIPFHVISHRLPLEYSIDSIFGQIALAWEHPANPRRWHSAGLKVTSRHDFVVAEVGDWTDAADAAVLGLPAGTVFEWRLFVHDWILVPPFWILPVAWLVRHRRRRVRARRERDGRCPGCGYDLRATVGRCPECGIVAVVGHG